MLQDRDKSREQLLAEVEALRAQVSRLQQQTQGNGQAQSVSISRAQVGKNADDLPAREDKGPRDGNNLCEALLSGIADGVMVEDRGGRLLYANDAAAQVLGYPDANTLLHASPAATMERVEVRGVDGEAFPPMRLPGRRVMAGEEKAEELLRFQSVDGGDEHHVFVRAVPATSGSGPAEFAVTFFHDAAERLRAQEAQRFLIEAGALLASSLDYETTLANVARLAVPGIADWCAVYILQDDRSVQPLTVAHVDPAKVKWAYELLQCYPPSLDDEGGTARVIRTRESAFFPEVSDDDLAAMARDEEHLKLLQGVGLSSLIIVPLIARDRILGALTLAAEAGRHFKRHDLTMAEELARRAAVAVENAQFHRRVEEALQHHEYLLEQQRAARKRAEAAEQRFRTLAETVPQQVWTARPDGQLDYVNSRALEYFNRAEAEILGSGWQSVVHPDDLPLAATRWKEALATRSLYETEFRLRRGSDGEYRWHIARALPFRDEEGRVLQWFGTNTDITERKRSEEMLAERARMAALGAEVGKALTTGADLGEMLHHCAAAMVTYLDAAFARIWLLNPRENVLELQASAGMYTHLDGPHSRVPVGAYKIGRIAASRQPHLTNDVPNDPQIGDREWARREGMIAFAGHPLIVEGKLVGVLAMFSKKELSETTLDALESVTTEIAVGIRRKRAENALQESEARIRFALAAARMGTWDWDLKSNRVEWSENAEEIHGLPPGSFGGSFDDYLSDVHPEDRDLVLESARRALEEGHRHDVEYRIVRPDGSTLWVAGKGRVIHDENGRPVRMSGICMDIDERKRAQEAQRFLAEASTLLASTLEYETTLGRVAKLAVPRIADWCAVDIVGEDGEIRRLAVEHVDAAKVELARELEQRYPPRDTKSSVVLRVIESGRSEIARHIPEEVLVAGAWDEDHLNLVRRLGLRSYIVAPLIARGRTLGAVTFVTAESGRQFGEHDLALVEELAHRAALAVDNARLYHQAQALNAELERRVQERTADLEAALKELESFSYSVSHDLRAPLRSMDGFSLALMEDYGGRLDGDALDYLRRIRAASQRMAQLIDDLLRLSRITRSEMQRDEVNMSAMAQEIISTLRNEQPNREVAVDVEQGLIASGDRQLLRIALENLLGNAWKFTRGREVATIEFGALPKEGQTVYYVRDNGAGFDMRYEDKLFTPFQRLHQTHEFEGSGIGLATTQRIIRRHGGAIWGEGAVDGGATFFFTLNPTEAPAAATGR